MVITGNSAHNSLRGKVQLIQIAPLEGARTPRRECLQRRRHPLSGFFIMGTYLPPTPQNTMGSVLTCGDIGDTRSDYCHKYDAYRDVWFEEGRMHSRRSNAACVWIDAGKWWVTGGNGRSLIDAETSEVYEVNTGVFWRGPILPIRLEDHCVVKIDADNFLLFGGEAKPPDSTIQPSPSNRAWVYNLRWKNFTEAPSMTFRRRAPSCSLIRKPNGERFVVAAGGMTDNNYQRRFYTKTTEMFDLQTWRWRGGPDLPRPLAAARGLDYGDTMIIVAGHEVVEEYNSAGGRTLDYSDRILELEFYRTWWSSIFHPNSYYERWIERWNERLRYGTAGFPAFWVPDSWC